MYAALWWLLPGRWPLRLLIVLLAVVAVAYLLIFHGYPWVMQAFFPTPDPLID